MANGIPSLSAPWEIPPAAPPLLEPWKPAQETERIRLQSDLRRLDTQRERALNDLRNVLSRTGVRYVPEVVENFVSLANDLRKALEPFDTGEVSF